jgi:fructoselysine-6-P-deglycase FrlB-like protein
LAPFDTTRSRLKRIEAALTSGGRVVAVILANDPDRAAKERMLDEARARGREIVAIYIGVDAAPAPDANFDAAPDDDERG